MRWCAGRRAAAAVARSNGLQHARNLLLGDAHGRDQVVTGALALDDGGKILGMRMDALHAMGSHIFEAVDRSAAIRDQARPWRLQHSCCARRRKGGSDQHRPDGALPRCRPARSDLPDRAAHGPRRPGHRRRSDRDQTPQFRAVVRHAAQAALRRRYRQRRVHAGDGRVPEARRLERLFQARRRIEESAASCAAAVSAISWKKRRSSTTAW